MSTMVYKILGIEAYMDSALQTNHVASEQCALFISCSALSGFKSELADNGRPSAAETEISVTVIVVNM